MPEQKPLAPPPQLKRDISNTFVAGLMTQIRVIRALILREMLTRFGDRKLGYVWVAVEPTVQVAIFVAIRSILGLENVRDIHVVPFLISGIIPYIYFRNVVGKIMRAIHSNRGLLVFAQIRFPDLFFARFLLETATYTVIFLVTMTITNAYITPISINSISGTILSFLLIGYCGFGVGLISAAIIPVFDALQSYVNVVLRILYFVSGILFSISLIPQEYHGMIWWNPVVHLIEIFRYNLLSGFHSLPYFMSISYVLLFSTTLTLLGFILVKRMKKWVLR